MADKPSSNASIALRIRLPFRDEEELRARFGHNFSATHLFIGTKNPKAIGVRLVFELLYADGSAALRGEGVVAESTTTPPRPGMSIEFRRLDATSRALVDRLTARGVGTPAGGEARAASASPPALTERLRDAAASRDAVARAVAEARARAAAAAVRTERREKDLGPEPAIGIDLGTTNARVAAIVGGSPRILPLRGGQSALPAVVHLDREGNFSVGQRARGELLTEPAHTVFGAKRLLGRRFEAKRVQELAARLPYPIAPDESGDAAVELRGALVPLTDVTAQLLSELRDAAQEALGREVRRAVISVPAYYRDRQRGAVKNAAAKAGLTVERLLSEPTATALAYGAGRGLPRRRVLVYDLGGGTFDASVLEVTGDTLEVITTGGDDFVGGQDFDERLLQELVARFSRESGAALDPDPVVALRLRDAAEAAKIALSSDELTKVHVPWVATGANGEPIHLQLSVDRQTLERLTVSLIDRTLEVTREVLAARGLRPEQMDEVILAGGQTLMPLVRAKLEAFVGRPPNAELDPHDSVALGAALLGAAIAEQRDRSHIEVRELLASPIGIVVEGKVERVFDRNTALPAQKALTLRGDVPGDALEIVVVQGDGTHPEDCEFLGMLHASAPKSCELEVHLALDTNAIVSASARDGRTGKLLQARFSTAGTSEEVRAAIEAQHGKARSAPDYTPELPSSGLFGGLKKLLGGGKPRH